MACSRGMLQRSNQQMASPSPTRRAPPHGPVDAGFSQDMSLHHEQALLLSRLVIAHGTPRLRPVAEAIINQQLKEIGYMQGWLMLWGEPRLSASDDMKWAREAYVRSQQREPAYDQLIESCVKDKAMPGLASPEEIEAFEKLRSPDAVDQTYLTLMIRHHQGAIIMARFASDHAESSVVRAFARSMGAEQQNEIRQMATMLRSLSQPDHHIS